MGISVIGSKCAANVQHSFNTALPRGSPGYQKTISQLSRKIFKKAKIWLSKKPPQFFINASSGIWEFRENSKRIFEKMKCFENNSEKRFCENFLDYSIRLTYLVPNIQLRPNYNPTTTTISNCFHDFFLRNLRRFFSIHG